MVQGQLVFQVSKSISKVWMLKGALLVSAEKPIALEVGKERHSVGLLATSLGLGCRFGVQDKARLSTLIALASRKTC